MSVTAGHIGALHWEVPGAPANGFDELTFPFWAHTAPTEAGWFWAYWFEFVGRPSGGYTGVQPRTSTRQSTKFSVFGAGTELVQGQDDGCHGGADGGSGSTCSAWSPFATGNHYEFRAFREAPASRVWRGEMTEVETARTWPIGAWRLDVDGGLRGRGQGFLEWYLSRPSCRDIPQTSLHFLPPRHDPSGTVGRAHGPWTWGKCKGETANYSATAKDDGSVWMRAGWPDVLHHRRPTPRTVIVDVDVQVRVPREENR